MRCDKEGDPLHFSPEDQRKSRAPRVRGEVSAEGEAPVVPHPSVRIVPNSLLKVPGPKKKIGKSYSLSRRTVLRSGPRSLSTCRTVLASSAVRDG